VTPTTEAARAIVARLETDAAVYAREVDTLTEASDEDDLPHDVWKQLQARKATFVARRDLLRDVLRWLPRELCAVEVAMVEELDFMDRAMETVA
jgi:hypothetical protein